MKRELLYYSFFPISVILGLTGCSTTPDVADYLKLQCEANPNMDTAHEGVEMIPGQKINIGQRSFDLTEKGRLRYTESSQNVIEIGQRDFIVNGIGSYNRLRYLVILDISETGNKTRVDVSLNCKNPTAED